MQNTIHVRESTVNAIGNYLATRPYNEVVILLAELQTDINAHTAMRAEIQNLAEAH